MNRKYLWIGFFMLLFAACKLSAAQPTPALTLAPVETSSATQTYPLEAGAYWLYQGQVGYEKNGEIMEEEVQRRVEVLEKVERLNVTGYLMSGALYDLAFYTPETTPSEYAILQVGGRFYRADLDTYARLKDESDYLVELVSESSIFLDLPVQEGDRFCETMALTRDDGMYCWVVGAPEEYMLESQPVSAYPLEYRTNPDYSRFLFAPGIGFVAFSYHHSGSVSEVSVELVEYSLGGNSQ